MTWPTSRPGYPGPSGAYVLRREDGTEFPAWWSDGTEHWTFRGGATMRPETIADGCALSLVGPLYTQADLDAAVQAERDGCIDVLNGHAEYDRQLCCDGRECGCLGMTVHQSIEHYIRARGPTSELDAALAQAREKAIKDAAAYLLEQMNPTRDREAAVDLLRIFAERSAAAGEEGR